MYACVRFEKIKIAMRGNFGKVIHQNHGIHLLPIINYEHYFAILGVKKSADRNTVRDAYIDLVKKVHPDSGFPEASETRFKEINEAFKMLQKKFESDRINFGQTAEENEIVEKNFNIKHTTPQHRGYLSNHDVGSGTPLEREKKYQTKKAEDAYENVYQYRLKKLNSDETSLLAPDSQEQITVYQLKKKVGIEQMVEDLILESMMKGDFKELEGFGKPLKKNQDVNPYIDFTTQKLNKILIENGFTPEWISLQKDIRQLICELKIILRKDVYNYMERMYICELDTETVNKLLKQHEFRTKDINKMIDHFNLIVPILNKQMFHIKLIELSENIVKELKSQPMVLPQKNNQKTISNKSEHKQKMDLFTFICSLF